MEKELITGLPEDLKIQEEEPIAEEPKQSTEELMAELKEKVDVHKKKLRDLSDVQILHARPEGMSFEEYKRIQKETKRRLKFYKQNPERKTNDGNDDRGGVRNSDKPNDRSSDATSDVSGVSDAVDNDKVSGGILELIERELEEEAGQEELTSS